MELEVSEESRIRSSIVEAMVQNYPLMSCTQEVNVKVATASDAALSCATRLGDSLTKLQALSQAMSRVGQLWRKERQVALGTVEQHQKLLAFLEAPSVLQECIRNEMYHEALVVLEHVRRSSRPIENVEFLHCVEAEVLIALQQALEEQILPRLAEQLTVASALKLTTFLRRLGVEETYIRQLFLLKRGEYIDGHVHEAERSGAPYSRIFRYLTTFKVHVAEVVLQYTACFSGEVDGGSCSELVGWCHARSFVFLERLRACLERIANGSELASVIEQYNNCASAAALVHMDIFGLISEAVSSRVKSLFAEQLSLATQSYSASMATFSWRPPTDAQRQALQINSEVEVVPGITSSPPVGLLQWLPLAYALNGILTAFNSIRKCVVPGVESFCVAKVEELMQIIARDLSRDRDVLMAVEGAEKHAYLLFVHAFVHEFYTHVLVCVRELLGDEAQQQLAMAMQYSVEGLRGLLSHENKPSRDATRHVPHCCPSPDITLSQNAPPINDVGVAHGSEQFLETREKHS